MKRLMPLNHPSLRRNQVFVNDPTMCYGLYIEWMIGQE